MEQEVRKPFFIRWTINLFILLFMVIANIPVLLIKLLIFLVGAIIMGIGQVLFMAGGYVVFFFRIITFAGVLMGILILCKAMDTTTMPWFMIPLILGTGLIGSWFTEWLCTTVYTVGDTIKDFGWSIPLVRIGLI